MLFLFFSVALALAPLYTVKEPFDREGLREYIVLLSYDGPQFGHDLEKLRDWVKQDFSVVDSNKINEIWSIGNFSGFPVLLSPEGVHELRQHNYVRLIEEVQKNWIDPREMDTTNVLNASTGAAFTTRVDWRQMRAQQAANFLQTNPPDWYTATELATYGYPLGGAQTYTASDPESWSWNGPTFAPPNTGSGAFVWITDTGVNYLHQEFTNLVAGGTRVTVRVDCSGDNTPSNCPAATVDDLNGHGSHCAGTCCGNYRGMAPGAGIGSIRIFDDQTNGKSTWTIRGLNYASNNKIAGKWNIASMSVGGGYSPSTNDAVAAAVANRLTVVVAAGNDGSDACSYSPASAPDAITVGATNALDTRAGFSNYGSCTGILAPGVQIHSAWMTSDPSNPNVYNTIDGTSMATPCVAGALALYGTRSPNASPLSAKQALYRYAKKGLVQDVQAPAENNRFLYAQFAP